MTFERLVPDFIQLGRRQRHTAKVLSSLSDRALADLGLERTDIKDVARVAARPQSASLTMAQLVQLARDEDFARSVPARPALLPGGLDAARLAAHQARADAIADSVIGISRGLAGAVRWLASAMGLAESAEMATLRKVRNQAYERVMAELSAYSDRELNGDLRIARSQLPELAGQEADQRLAQFVRRNPAYRAAFQGAGGRPADGFAHG